MSQYWIKIIVRALPLIKNIKFKDGIQGLRVSLGISLEMLIGIPLLYIAILPI